MSIRTPRESKPKCSQRCIIRLLLVASPAYRHNAMVCNSWNMMPKQPLWSVLIHSRNVLDETIYLFLKPATMQKRLAHVLSEVSLAWMWQPAGHNMDKYAVCASLFSFIPKHWLASSLCRGLVDLPYPWEQWLDENHIGIRRNASQWKPTAGWKVGIPMSITLILFLLEINHKCSSWPLTEEKLTPPNTHSCKVPLTKFTAANT